MKINRYIGVAAFLILVVYLAYFVNFYLILDYKVSNDSAIWGQLGGYAGGILSPLLSFVSIVLLIKSLSLQNEANNSLRKELKNNEKTEKIRSFETLFFNLVNSQKKLFESFKVDFIKGDELIQLLEIEAVMKIEDDIEEIREVRGGGDQEVKKYLEGLDKKDKIFGLSRAFYIIVMMTSEKLSDSEGFSEIERKTYFMSLVNFTDFAQLRLIMICVQFMDYESTKYIRSSMEFKKVIEDLGMSYELY